MINNSICPSATKLVAVVAALLSLACPYVDAQPLAISKGAGVTLTRAFSTVETKAGTPSGVSGIACLPAKESKRSCISVNDEERFAEWATLDKDTLIPSGKKVQLLTIHKKQKDLVVGAMPVEPRCAEVDDFEEFDGEAVALSDGVLYVTGSHACSRKKGKFRPSAFILARFKATGNAIEAKEVERTWRLTDLIRNSPLKEAFAVVGAGGIGVEGLAVSKGRVYIGLRTPVINETATILHSDVEPLFSAGSERLTAKPEVISIGLGRAVGIRDLAALPDGRLLVLSGSTNGVDTPFVVHVLWPSTGKHRPIVELKTDIQGKGSGGVAETAKAEAISVLDVAGQIVTLLVAYDNIDGGGMRIHRLTLPVD